MAPQLTRAQSVLARALCRDFQAWAPWEPRPPRVGRTLPQGLSNRSVLLRGARQRYVLRLARTDALPGVDRAREKRLLAAAARAGLAPPPLLHEVAAGILITPVAGEPVAPPPAAEAVAALLRDIHALPGDGPILCSIELNRQSLAQPPADPALAAALAEQAAAIGAAERVIGRAQVATVTCHNDLLAANLRRDGQALLALDWEFACRGDPFFDLAVCAWEQPDEAAVTALLEHYLQRPAAPDEHTHLAAQRLLYAVIDACWRQRYAATRSDLALSLRRLDDAGLAFRRHHGTF